MQTKLLINGALVQGEGSVEEVVRGIEYFSRTKWPDVVIVGRGAKARALGGLSEV